MDFKIAGTKKGITALQLDIKVPGISNAIVFEAIDQGFIGINQILEIMSKTLSVPRNESEKADILPVIKTFDFPTHLKPRLYRSNGIKKIEAETGVQSTWLDETKLSVFAPNQDMMNEASDYLNTLLTPVPELVFGTIYEAVIKEIQQKGILVTLYEEMIPAFVHVSQLDTRVVSRILQNL